MVRVMLFLLLALYPIISTAQSVKVVVKGAEGSIPYVYLSVNGRSVGSTDSLGVGWISSDKLSVGDTISAYYVGTIPVCKVYSEEIRKSSVCELIYDQPIFGGAINQVIIAGSAEGFLAKSLKDSYSLSVNGIIEADFEATLISSDSSRRTIRGTLVAENRVKDKKFERFCQYGYFHLVHEIKTLNDTIGFNHELRIIARSALGSFGNGHYSSSSRLMYKKNYYNKYGFMGEENGARKFRITYKPKSNDQIIYQNILYVDMKTRSLIRSQASVLVKDSTYYNATVAIDYAGYVHKKRQEMLIQKNIDYTIESKNGINSIRITNIRFKTQ